MTYLELVEERALAYKARKDILSSGVSSYSIAGRTLTRLDLRQLNRHISYLDNEIAKMTGNNSGGSAGFRGVTICK